MSASSIRVLLSDVDGTLVDSQKALTDASVRAARDLTQANVLLALTSGRPPRGMSMLIEPLDLQTPIAAFNGGLLVDRNLSVIQQRVLSSELSAASIALLESSGLSVWVYRGSDWYVRDLHGPHIEREQYTVQFAPTLVQSFEDLGDGVAKVVGVSDDFAAVAQAADAARDRFGEQISASCSQPYYLDITHPQANKGEVVRFLAAHYAVPIEAIATIGDGPNDTLMFADSGLSIAMGNANPQVQSSAQHLTSSNDQDGFAEAVERFILTDRHKG
ncbi:MAG: HAD family hydrolase [Solirubrobacteraceae bacterium]